jgi:hypothetical protein
VIGGPPALSATAPVVESTVQHAQACTVCEHPADAHDAIGRRFCEATQSKALSRGCICRPA